MTTLRTSFRIGPWLVEPDQNRLMNGDTKRQLLPRSMEVLVYLAQHHGSLVHSAELIEALWGERFVGENPLYKHVALLRQALKLTANDEKYIQTIPKKGYQLVAPTAFADNYQHQKQKPHINWTGGSPFRGLRTFEAEHAEIFFGRERMVRRISQALLKKAELGSAFLLVLGSSGSGKSSLIRAGVIPHCSNAMIDPAVHHWYHALYKPSDSPKDLLGGLAQAIVASGLTTPKDSVFVRQLALRMATEPDNVDSLLTGFVSPEEMTRKKLILFIDQLEELFVLSNISESQRNVFMDVVQMLANLGYVWVIAAMRNDYYPRCTELEGLAELKLDSGQIDVDPPTPSEIGQMIRLPALAANLEFEEEPGSHRRLDDMLRDEAINQPGSLPLLEFTLDTLYERRQDNRTLSIAAYQELGGLSGALAQRADSVFDSLSNVAKDNAARVFNALVDIDATTGQRTKVPQVWPIETGPVHEVIEQFVNNRLLISELNDQEQRVISLAHEALINYWPRLREWLNANDELLRIRHRVQNSAQRWSTELGRKDLLLPAGRRLQEALALLDARHIDTPSLVSNYIRRSEKLAKRNKWLKRATIGVISGAAITTSLSTLYAVSKRNEAREQQAQAEDLVSFMVGDLRTRLVAVGRLDILDSVGDKALAYFSSQNIQELNEASLINRAKALEQIGQVRLQEGNLSLALTAFSTALASSQEVVTRNDANLDARFALGNAHYWVGYVHWKLGQLDDTQSHWETYYNIALSLTVAQPASKNYRLELSYALNNLGTIAGESGKPIQAIKYFKQSIAAKAELVALEPGNSDFQIELADSLSWLASTFVAQGQLTEAQDHYTRMLKIAQSSATADSENATGQYRLGLAHQHVGNIKLLLGKVESATGHFDEAERIANELISRDSTNSRWLRDRAFLTMRKAQVHFLKNNLEQAERAFTLSSQELNRLVLKDPNNRSWQQLHSINRIAQLELMFQLREQPLISEAHYLAIRNLQDDLDHKTLTGVSRHWLARGYLLLHKISAQQHDPKKASDYLSMALSVINSSKTKQHHPRVQAVAYEIFVAEGEDELAQQHAKRLWEAGYREPRFVRECRANRHCELPNSSVSHDVINRSGNDHS